MLDDNGDGILTIKEIKDRMKFHKIILQDDEWNEFLKALDKNSDGCISLDEWV
jgi:Ca2+-binding EF-hand superfamily protein